MPRKSPSPIPQSANLSVEHIKSALPRLDRRIDDLRAFDPTTVAGRDDPKTKRLENAIDNFLTRTFEMGSVEYNRYCSATNLDTSPIFVGRITPLHEVVDGLQRGKNGAIEILEGIKNDFLEELELTTTTTAEQVTQDARPHPTSREIFVVHGTDHGTRDTVARFLEKLNLKPIILDEEANEGRTIHQKFRDHSTVAYAVVLFTPDDEGRRVDGSEDLKCRPRQNVVYELGFFSAKLGDSNVCVLHSDGVDILSDLSGVLYVALDKDGAWKFRLAKEIKAAGITIDMNLV